MNEIQSFVNDLAAHSANADLSDTFRDDQGIVRCRRCGERRVAFIHALGRELPVSCRCWAARAAAAQKAQAVLAADFKARSSAFYSSAYDAFTFDTDSHSDSEASQQCRGYMNRWAQMCGAGIGALICGRVGTGKTYRAAAMVNDARTRGVSAIICTASNLIAAAQASRAPLAVINELDSFSLVALDDLGAERSTDFGISVIESFIDARALSRRPLVVTTNLGAAQMRQPEDLRWARIFDRVLNLCPLTICCTGESLRQADRKARAAQAAAILNGEEVRRGV